MVTMDKFLPDTNMKKLYKLKKEEENPKVVQRITAYMLKKEGKTLWEISNSIKIPYTTVQNWIDRINKEGIDARYDKKQPGAQCKLDKKQINKLIRDLKKGPQKCGYDTNLWTSPIIQRHIKKIFKTDYNVSSVWALITRLDLHLVAPRPRNDKAATPEEIAVFKKKAHRKVKYYSDKGHTIMTMDAAHKLVASVPKKGWFFEKRPVFITGKKKPKKKSAKNKSKKSKSLTIIGAIGAEKEYYFRFYDTGNWVNVENFLQGVHKKFGKVLMFMDNAAYHKKDELKRITRETGGQMQFEFYLKYTPELNPIEPEWSVMKKSIAGIIATNAELKRIIARSIKNKTIPIVKMFDYLIP